MVSSTVRAALACCRNRQGRTFIRDPAVTPATAFFSQPLAGACIHTRRLKVEPLLLRGGMTRQHILETASTLNRDIQDLL